MNFETTCPHCHRSIKARDEHEGKRLACPGCKQMFVVKRPAQASIEAEAVSQDEYRLADAGFGAAPPPQSAADDLGNFADHLNAPASPYAAPASFAARPAAYTGNLPESRSYPALNVVRMLLLVLAGLVAISWVITLIVAVIGIIFAAGDSPQAAAGVAGVSLTYVGLTFFTGSITICMLVASSEMIKVVLDIQSNTLAAARR